MISRVVENTSSQKLIQFLEAENLHKKDFAEMIGVTLSYVYSLIDEAVPFSTRTTTLERIAVVMNVSPEIFPEYRLSEEPKMTDSGVEYLKRCQKRLNLNNIQLIKKFPRNQRLNIVDMWRGNAPIPLDWSQLMGITSTLEIRKEDIYPFWQARMQQHLASGGIDPFANIGLLNAIFTGAKDYINI